MSPSSNNAGMELPPPIEQTPKPSNPAETGQKSEEQAPAAFEQAASPSVAAAMPLTIPLPTPTAVPSGDDSAQTDQVSVDTQLLKDKDLIEKEWVNKAKNIVESNREDPYKQSEGMTMLKADYMKKQFNKTLKLNK